MSNFFKFITQIAGSSDSATSPEVINPPNVSATSPTSPISNDDFLGKYGLIIGGVVVVLVIVVIIIMMNKNGSNTSTTTTTVTSNNGASTTTNSSSSLNVKNASSNVVAYSNNNNSMVLQDASVNGNNVSSFQKVNNGVVTTQPTNQDLATLNQIKQANLAMAEQQKQRALEQANATRALFN